MSPASGEIIHQLGKSGSGAAPLAGESLEFEATPEFIGLKRTQRTQKRTTRMGQFAYKVNMRVDRFGRAMLCESQNATHHLSDYGSRICAD